MTEFTTWRSLVDGAEISAIPDIGMFESPKYQWFAGLIDEADSTSPVDFPEGLEDIDAATSIGDPTFRQDTDAFPSVEYDGVDDAHDFDVTDLDMNEGSESFSLSVLFKVVDGSDRQAIISYGTEDGIGEVWLETDGDGGFGFNSSGRSGVQGGSVPDGELVTGGVSYDGSTIRSYFNGDEVDSDEETLEIGDEWYEFGSRNGDFHLDGNIIEIIYSQTAESGEAFSDYHEDRLGD